VKDEDLSYGKASNLSVNGEAAGINQARDTKLDQIKQDMIAFWKMFSYFKSLIKK